MSDFTNDTSEEYKKDILEKYEIEKRYTLITGLALSIVLLILVFLLVYAAIPLATQQALIAVIGMVLLATLNTFNRGIENRAYSPTMTIFDSRQNIHTYTTINRSNYGKQNLVEAAKEIQELLEHLSQTYPTETEKEKMDLAEEVADEIKQNKPLSYKLLAAFKTGKMEDLEVAINHPLSNIVVTMLGAYLESLVKVDNTVEETTDNTNFS